MKLKESKNLSLTLKIIFEHLKKYNIESSLDKFSDKSVLYNNIMDSEITELEYLANINNYLIDYLLPDNLQVDETLYFHCRNKSNSSKFSLLIDNFENSGSIQMEFSFEKYPIFVKDFLTGDKKFKIDYFEEESQFIEIDDKEIISNVEFEKFIEDNNISVGLIFIEVE